MNILKKIQEFFFHKKEKNEIIKLKEHIIQLEKENLIIRRQNNAYVMGLRKILEDEIQFEFIKDFTVKNLTFTRNDIAHHVWRVYQNIASTALKGIEQKFASYNNTVVFDPNTMSMRNGKKC